MTEIQDIIQKLCNTGDLTRDEIITILENRNAEIQSELAKRASETAQEHYGNKVYVRGLIEFTNYCRNDCYYCGIRCGNKNAERYLLSKEEIVECASYGYGLGFRTIVLQGGEDMFYTDDMMVDIIKSIKKEHPDCAVTLSIGEKSYDTYKAFFDAGADRYLLRHETADFNHYAKLHPKNLSAANRQQCLYNLKKIGFQTGAAVLKKTRSRDDRNRSVHTAQGYGFRRRESGRTESYPVPLKRYKADASDSSASCNNSTGNY